MPKKFTEKRQHPRHRFNQNGPFAVTGPKADKLGQIVDISLGGMAYCYFDDQEWSPAAIDYKILFNDPDFSTTDIRTKIISNQIIKKQTPTGEIILHRQGVQFIDPPPLCVQALKNFIANHFPNQPANPA
ncbi:MAG: PilZ domain-containing protein [Proteobacteria bacterium]|nr:PilZ domain-containing protein [Pseudomonadota bacterium]MBU1716592.1 PilZ domain-containing protein [Pseudomonadota bacterium]